MSDKLATAEFEQLHGLVKNDLIDSLRDVIESMTVKQRSNLRVRESDICRIFVSAIDIIEENDDDAVVDISMIYHVVRNFKEITNVTKQFLKVSSV